MQQSDVLSKQLAGALLQAGAVMFRINPPFQWTSGRLSPVYCDNRILLGFPQRRKLINDGFLNLVQQWPTPPTAVAGVATAGIPHAAVLADRLEMPLAYVRGQAKAHGRQNRIEGRLPQDAQVLVVEDLISTAGSSVQAIEALRNEGYQVAGVVAIFSYGFAEAERALAENAPRHATLTDWPTLLEVAQTEGWIDQNTRALIGEWRSAPATWSPNP
jgi:orotate phosphoribosyltransferase